MANAVTGKILAALALQTFTICLSQSELLDQPDEECLLQSQVHKSESTLEFHKEFHKEFADYAQKHGRRYEANTEEYKKRYDLFSKRFQDVQAQNQRKDALWTAALNTYTDRTEEELAQLRGWRGYTRSAGHVAPNLPSSMQLSLAQRSNLVLPEAKNWSHLKAVQQTMDQGSCGSCWAVAAAMTLQANAENACHDRTFSAQEIVACVQNPHHCGGNGGCQGATVELAMQHVIDHGLATEKEVPYLGTASSCKNGESLLDAKHHSIQHINDVAVEGVHSASTGKNMGAAFGMMAWERLPENQYKPLLLAVSERGPVAVSVEASPWFLYNGGIFDGCSKDAEVDHAVTLIGFGKQGHTKYWTIKNSWGPDWGENGQIRLLRTDADDTEQCGIDHNPEVGTACDGGPKQVKVCGMCGILYDTVVPHFAKACKK